MFICVYFIALFSCILEVLFLDVALLSGITIMVALLEFILVAYAFVMIMMVMMMMIM